MISEIIKVEVSIISQRLKLITPTKTLIIPDITKTESNNVLIYVVLKKITRKRTACRRSGSISHVLLCCKQDATHLMPLFDSWTVHSPLFFRVFSINERAVRTTRKLDVSAKWKKQGSGGQGAK